MLIPRRGLLRQLEIHHTGGDLRLHLTALKLPGCAVYCGGFIIIAQDAALWWWEEARQTAAEASGTSRRFEKYADYPEAVVGGKAM